MKKILSWHCRKWRENRSLKRIIKEVDEKMKIERSKQTKPSCLRIKIILKQAQKDMNI
jgi:hypothetical protein